MELNHKHIIVNAVVENPPGKEQIEHVKQWLVNLVQSVNMKVVVGPIVAYCEAQENEGITGAVCIETSHASIHVWDKLEEPLLRFDLYSCATFDPYKVLAQLEQFMPIKCDWIILDRNHNTVIQEKGERCKDYRCEGNL